MTRNSGPETQTAHFGFRLRGLREERGISMRSLAATVGLSPSRISALEKSPLPSLRVTTLLRIQAALDTPSFEQFLGDLPSRIAAANLSPPDADAGLAASNDESAL